MHLWHLTPDTPRRPHRPSPGDLVTLGIGTWPIAPGQAVWITWEVAAGQGPSRNGRAEARWQRNADGRSYWEAELGPFLSDEQVRYTAHARDPSGPVTEAPCEFRVGPKVHIALVWHHHQPHYRPGLSGPYRQPWVRLHALRDYYGMAALLLAVPDMHATINLTPVLLAQLEEYAAGEAVDRALELTLRPAERLTAAEREEMLRTFFEADWHHQVYPHQRYTELFTLRLQGARFGVQDLRDLQMWFNLAWFAREFRDGDVALVTGDVVRVHRFVRQARGFTVGDVAEMVAEQRKVLRAIVPIHRALQARGQIELSTTPFYHPILPLLADSDSGTLDRPGATRPPRFVHPEDVEAQVRLAIEQHARVFGGAPRGMWPAEGAVTRAIVAPLARAGVAWIATDEAVLAHSGRWGYRTEDPSVLARPYRVEEEGSSLAVFFRDARLSNAIGFDAQREPDPAVAAGAIVADLRCRYADTLNTDEDRIVTIVLDGENAWGSHPEDGRPFLQALYGLLAADPELKTVTPAEYLTGNPSRGVDPHPSHEQAVVFELFGGSWIDEEGSAPGPDLGTWIGELEENAAWALLARARAALAGSGASEASAPEAHHAVYAAEGSDWFWWLGQDQDSGRDWEFESLFRDHLAAMYRLLDLPVSPELTRHLLPHPVTWTFAAPVAEIQPDDRLAIVTNCAGELEWREDDGPVQRSPLFAVGGALGGTGRFRLSLGPLGPHARRIEFRFRCTHAGCRGEGPCGESVWRCVAVAHAQPVRDGITTSQGE